GPARRRVVDEELMGRGARGCRPLRRRAPRDLGGPLLAIASFAPEIPIFRPSSEMSALPYLPAQSRIFTNQPAIGVLSLFKIEARRGRICTPVAAAVAPPRSVRSG